MAAEEDVSPTTAEAPPQPTLPFETIVSIVAGDVATAENAIGRVSKNHPIFSTADIVRELVALCASGPRKPTLVVGAPGAGKSTLLRHLHERISTTMPNLRVLHATPPCSPKISRAAEGAHTVDFLRGIWEQLGDEEAPPDAALVHNGAHASPLPFPQNQPNLQVPKFPPTLCTRRAP